MPAGPSAYLVARRDDGFGEVFPLQAGMRTTLGRSPTNRIVLKDDLCSRDHAEVYFAEGNWYLRDLNSLNGSRVNDDAVQGDFRLAPNDEVQLGRGRFLFVEELSQLPGLPMQSPGKEEHLEIKKRLGTTRYLLPQKPPPRPPGEGGDTVSDARRPDQALAILYRLALDMGSAGTAEDLVEVVLDGLLEAIPAEVGAVLELKEGRELEVVAYRHRNPNARTYHKVSQFVSNEVLANKEAILAENISQDRHLSARESLAELRAASLICAPVMFEGKVIGLVHLYSANLRQPLTSEDLEFALAVARQLGVAWHQLRRQTTLSATNQSLRDQLRIESELVGASDSLQVIENQIARVASTNATVLIRGESGSGKELVARAIHHSSPRRDSPFVCLNCAALTESLLESELFGHEKGAFTGATEKMVGKFEAANHGTIFLDEIGEMPLSTQSKFLRVLEGHPFERVGGNTQIRVDVRVVAATNRPLEEAVRSGLFRRDLFFRLQVVEITVPPLRERLSDVPSLAEHFLKRFVRETGRKIKGFTPAALQKLQGYHWPGNVRELRNVIERAVALSVGPTLDAGDIWLSSLDLSMPSSGPVYEPISIEEMEKRHILQTLTHTDWNKSKAAAILGIERSTLDRKIEKYELKR